MKKLLVVIDVQKDFVDGSLGTKEAVTMIDYLVDKINQYEKENQEVVYTLDTHGNDYLETQEGKKLPVAHCIKGEEGWLLYDKVDKNTKSKKTYFEKDIFGSTDLMDYIMKNQYDAVEMVGLCTDICVVSNALMLKSLSKELEITVDAKACAGVTIEKHLAALEVMKSCQINVINE